MLTMSNANVTFSGQSVDENGNQMAIFSASWLEDFDTIYYNISTQDNCKQPQTSSDNEDKVVATEEEEATTDSNTVLPSVEPVPEMAVLDMDVVDADFRAFREKVTDFYNRISKA